MVLISYLDYLNSEGMAVKNPAIAALIARLQPVLMTALTTALGLVPSLLATGTGSEVQKPLVTVVVPACYRYVSRIDGKS